MHTYVLAYIHHTEARFQYGDAQFDLTEILRVDRTCIFMLHVYRLHRSRLFCYRLFCDSGGIEEIREAQSIVFQVFVCVVGTDTCNLNIIKV